MNSSVNDKIYWVVTSLFCFLMILDGLSALVGLPSEIDVVRHLGFPVYCLTIMGISKILGAAALLQSRFIILKEWAYAGFTIVFILGSIAHWQAGDSLSVIGVPLLFLAGMFITYFFLERLA